MEEVVILNVDTNTLETPFDDHKRIPSDVVINSFGLFYDAQAASFVSTLFYFKKESVISLTIFAHSLQPYTLL